MIELQKRMVVLAELGLDTTCGGKSLEYVCRQQGLSPAAVLIQLRQVVAGNRPESERR